MQGVQIEESGGGLAASLSALAALVAVALGIWIGPTGIYAASGTGLALAVIALLQAVRVSAVEKPFGFPGIMIAAHAVFLGIAFLLHAHFLSPLAANQAKMPRLQTAYDDPEGIFALRGPSGWSYRPVPSRFEYGVRLNPQSTGRYAGVSEITVFVRRLDEVPSSPDAFLENAAKAFVQEQPTKRLFELKSERGTSLTGAPVIWSTLIVKRYWIPLYQITLFGVKDGRYLCSVSASGLWAHAALARLFCMGIFERIIVTDPKAQ